MIKRRILILLLLSQSLWGYSQKSNSITVAELMHHIEILASDSLQGRQAGTRFGKRAAEYIKKEFNNYGVKLLCDNGFQYFSISSNNSLREKHTHLIINNHSFIINKDFKPLNIYETDSICARAVFAGYGLKENYLNIDAKNKWVAIFTDNHPSDSTSLGDRLLIAKNNNAAGVLLLSDETEDDNESISIYRYNFDFPMLELSLNTSNYLLQSIGNTVQIKSSIINSNANIQQEIPVTICSKISGMFSSETTQNVVAIIEGNKPETASEYIVVGAHYDHLGLGGKYSGSRMPDTIAIHKGADDNASGIAVLLEVLQKLAHERNGINRSIVFVAFGAEEVGLLGSKNFVESGIIPTDRIKAMVNIDMVGRLTNNNLLVSGVGTAKQFNSILNNVNTTKLDLNLTKKCINNSDQGPFCSKRIPAILIHTGIHSDYHTPFDDIQSINAKGLQDIASFVYRLVSALGNADVPINFQSSQNETIRGISQSRIQLGIIHNFDSNETIGYRPLGVIPNKPVAMAGMVDGDIIMSINGQSINSIDDYLQGINSIETEEPIRIRLIRDNEEFEIVIDQESL